MLILCRWVPLFPTQIPNSTFTYILQLVKKTNREKTAIEMMDCEQVNKYVGILHSACTKRYC